MSDRITTTCQHSHTVTLRLDEGEVPTASSGSPWAEARIDQYGIAMRRQGRTKWSRFTPAPPTIRAELEAALAAAEASCGGCGCAERLRAEAARQSHEGNTTAWAVYADAADFLDAAPDARGSDPSAEDGEA